MSDLEGRAPDILDLVAAPEARECQLYGRRGEPEPCDNQADWLFVYDGRTGDETVPRNALACDECFNAPVETDGGLVGQWPSADRVVTVSNGGDSATVPADAEAVVVTDGIDATSYHRPQHDDVIATACNPERGALRIARDAAEAMGLHACTHHCCYGSQEVGR